MPIKKRPVKKAVKPAPVKSEKTEDPQVKDPEVIIAPDPEVIAPEATAAPDPEVTASEVATAPDPEVKTPEVKPKAADKKAKKDETFPMLERAREVFASHTVDILYFTEDNTAFLEPQFARIHAESLKSDKVTPIERKEIV